MSLAANCCRASTDMRPASARGWKDARLHGLVLTRLIVSYVMGVAMPAMEMRDLERMRDGFIDALPWAFDVSVEGDDEWPEPQQRSEGRCEAATVARRLAWFEAVLRITFAARRDKERLVRYMLPKAPEETAADAVRRTFATDPEACLLGRSGPLAPQPRSSPSSGDLWPESPMAASRAVPVPP